MRPSAERHLCEMLMVVRELAISIDKEDSLVAINDVSDFQDDSWLAQADLTQYWISLFTDGTTEEHRYHRWCHEDPVLRASTIYVFLNLK